MSHPPRSAAPGWLVEWVEADGNVHVIPLGDLIDHDRTDGCICGPTSELQTHDDAPDAWLVTHHSLDGREATERAPEIVLDFDDPV